MGDVVNQILCDRDGLLQPQTPIMHQEKQLPHDENYYLGTVEMQYLKQV